jgi:autotransporter-associated beta strand protein
MKKIPQFLLLSFALSAASVHGAVKYWDINGTTAGSGGATPGGTWSTGAANWNSDSAGGAGTLTGWTSGTADTAVFSAGTDATGEFTVNLPSALTAGFVTNEEGIVDLTGAALTVTNINIKNGAMLSYVSSGGITGGAGSRMNISGGTFRCNNAGVGSTFLPTAIAITLGNLGTAGGTLSVDGATTAISIYGGVISGTGPLTKAGQGIFRLTAVATYSGATTVTGGSLQISTTANVLPSATDLTINSGAKLDLQNNLTIGSLAGAGNVPVTGSFTLTTSGGASTTFSGVISGSGCSLTRSGSGTVTLTGVNTLGAALTISGGGINVASGAQLCGSACDLIMNGGTLSLTNTSQTIEDLGGSGGTIILNTGHTLNVNAGFYSTARPSNYLGVVTGPGNLTLGAGFLQLSGANTYSGTTTVNAGNLVLAGKYTANGATAINAGTLLLSGTNTGNGAIAVNGGTLIGLSGGACSNSVVTVAGGAANSVQVTNTSKPWTCGGLTYSGGALDFDFGHNLASALVPSTTLAPLQVNGNVDFTAGTPSVTIEALALPTSPGTYPLITWTGSLSGTAPSTIANLPPQTAANLTVAGNTLFLNVTANLEPLTWAAGSDVWDIGTTPNWKNNAGTVTNYLETSLPGDMVVFEDSQSGPSPITVTLNATVTPANVTATNSKSYTISGGGGITGSTKLTKGGSGVLTLATANTYTGPTIINAGTLQLGDGAANGSVTSDITNSASLVISNASGQTYSGVISGTGSLSKGSPGTLTLSGAHTFTGGQTVNDGTLQLTSTANAMKGAIAVTNATLQINSGACIGSTVAGAGNIALNNAIFQNDSAAVGSDFLTPNRTITIGPGGATINVPSSAAILFFHDAGLILGPGTLTKEGPGEVRTYLAHNTFSKLIVNNGMFCAGQSVNVGYPDSYCAIPGVTTPDAITIQNGGRLRLSGTMTNVLDPKQGITVGTGGGVIRTPLGNMLVIPGVITGSDPLTINSTADSGIIALRGANTFSGGLSLANGRLDISHPSALGLTASTFTIGAGGSTNAIFNTSGGALTVANNNPMIWQGNFAFTGTNDLNLGSGAVTLNVTPTVTVNANTLTVGGIISGSGLGLTKAGATTLQLNALNTYDGDTTISAGTLQLGDGTANNGSVAGNIVNNGTLLTWANPSAVSYSGVISGTGPMNKQATGTLTLGGASTYSGLTAILAGTLQLGANDSLPAATRVQVTNVATLDMNGFNNTINSLNGLGRVINNSGTLTVNGDLTTGAIFQNYSSIQCSITNGGLVKGGTHTMGLRETNTLAIPVTLTGSGTLSVGVISNQLPTSTALSIPAGATFQLDAVNQTVASLDGAGSVSLGGGALIVNQSINTNFSGVIQNSSLPGSSTAVGHGLRGYYYDNLDFTSLLVVRDDATVNFTDLTLAAQLPAPIYPNTNQVSVRWLGQVLTTTNGVYTFTTTCDDGSRLWINGTLVVDNWVPQGATAKNGTIALAANQRYDIMMEFFNNTGGASAKLSWTPPGDITNSIIPTDNLFLPGPGQLVKSGAGVLTLSGANTYSGGTVVNGGILDAQSALGTGDVLVNSATLTSETTAAIAATADLRLNGASVAHLNYSGSDTIHGLSFDGGATYQPANIYGATGSGATIIDDTHFTGTGTLTVTAVAATNLLASSANPAVYGNSLTFTSTVTGSGATPTGTVTFYDGASAIGTTALSSGVATLTVTKLSVAGSPHSITAVYNGDANYTHTSSSALSQTINPATLVPNVTVANRIYNGTTNASITSISLVGIASGDSPYLNVTSAPAFFLTKHVGVAKPVSITGLVLGGSLASDYVLPSTASTNANITQTNLTVTAGANTKPYDGNVTAAATPTITVGTIQIGDIANFSEAYATPDVGTNKTLIPAGSVTDGNSGANYSVAFVNSTNGVITALCSATNVLNGIAPNGNGTFTLSFQGSYGAQYYVQAASDLALSNWVTLAGSTNTITNVSGAWSYVVTNSAQKQFYRGAAVHVCP